MLKKQVSQGGRNSLGAYLRPLDREAATLVAKLSPVQLVNGVLCIPLTLHVDKSKPCMEEAEHPTLILKEAMVLCCFYFSVCQSFHQTNGAFRFTGWKHLNQLLTFFRALENSPASLISLLWACTLVYLQQRKAYKKLRQACSCRPAENDRNMDICQTPANNKRQQTDTLQRESRFPLRSHLLTILKCCYAVRVALLVRRRPG